MKFLEEHTLGIWVDECRVSWNDSVFDSHDRFEQPTDSCTGLCKFTGVSLPFCEVLRESETVSRNDVSTHVFLTGKPAFGDVDLPE